MASLITNPLIKKILEKYKVIWSLNHLSSLAYWDMETYMPKEGAIARGEALGKISTLAQSLYLNKDFIDLIKDAEQEKNLNDSEKGIVRLLNRHLRVYQKLPPEFLEEFEKTISAAFLSWTAAKEQNSFEIFAPDLEKIIDLVRKKAEYLGYKNHPYDALLDDFEEGLTTKEVELYFEEIKMPITQLLKKIQSSRVYRKEHALENETYEIEKMKILTQKILELLHYNMKHLRVDTSLHPFSTLIGKGDARITTRYEGKDFMRSLSSTIHEYGHALYELQSHEDLHYTPISGGASQIIHESQSRFWENFIARSKEFIENTYPYLSEAVPNLKNYSLGEIYEYVNMVRPSFIRTEADEITYHLHVLIRFEIEKELLEGKVSVKDLPKVWNDKYEFYLGIRPEKDSEGILQDVHWSQGLIGYFPTYSFGTSLSAMWLHHLEKELGSIHNLIKTQEGLRKIQNWLKQNVHQYGSTFTFRELVKKTTNEDFTSKYLLDYLEKKYSVIYSLN